MSINGKWQGKLIDASGVRGKLDLSIIESKGRVKGDFEIRFVSEDSGCCNSGDQRAVQSGPVDGKFDSKSGKLILAYGLTVGLKPIKVQLDAMLSDVKNVHAAQSILGCYDVESGSADLTLEGGGVVLWNYR